VKLLGVIGVAATNDKQAGSLTLYELRAYKPYLGVKGLEHKNHADGIFMQRMSEFSIVHPVPYVVGMNRRTPASVFCGASHDDPLHDQQVTDGQAEGLTSHLDDGAPLA
jgi:hypothetical protein